MKTTILTLTLGAAAMIGCSTTTTVSGGSTGKATNGLWAGYDMSAELPKLAGKWQVRQGWGKKNIATWTVSGNSVTAVKGDKTTKATLSLPMPGRISFAEAGGMTSHYSYARDGDKIWIGLGAGGTKNGDNYYIATSHGLVKFDGKSCTFHKKKMSFGDKAAKFEKASPVKCSVEGDTFKYQEPKFMKEGQFDDREAKIVGTALLSSQLYKDHLIVKAE